MATEQDVVDVGFAAGADISAKQFFCMKLHTTAGQVTVCSGATDLAIGLLQNKPAAAGRAARVAIGGISKGVAGAAISLGAQVGTDTNGRLVAKTTDEDWVIGVALTASTASGDVIDVLMTTGAYYAKA